MMASSSECSLLDDSHSTAGDYLETAFERTISGLKKCLNEYREKAKENREILQKLGYDESNIPASVRKNLSEVLSDNEVFDIHDVGSKELITINPQHIVESVRNSEELSQIRRLRGQLNTVIAELQDWDHNLERKLEIEKNQAAYLDEKANENAVQEMIFRGKLEKAQSTLKALQETSETLERPKYSLEQLQELNDEVMRLRAEVALTTTKLDKYNNLSLNEKEALRQLKRLKEELNNVENELNIKANS